MLVSSGTHEQKSAQQNLRPPACDAERTDSPPLPARTTTIDAEYAGCSVESMPGVGREDGSPIDPADPRQLKQRIGDLSFDRVFFHLSRLIDQLGHVPELLDDNGGEKCFHRAMALILHPDLFVEAKAAASDPVTMALERVRCQIRANLTEKIGLADLREWSGLSSRSLQYAFRKHLACTPMQWVQQQRLWRIRSRLLRPRPGDSVSSIALEFQFSNLGHFAGLYSKRYGELPSATLRQAMRKPEPSHGRY